MVGFQKRYAPAYVKAKEIIRTNDFGDLKHIQTKLCTGRMISGEDFVLEIGIHHLDLARFFFGEVSSVSVNASDRKTGEAYSVNLKFTSGAIGSMILSEQQSWFQNNERVEITGSGNYIDIENACKLTYFNKGLEVLGVPVSHLVCGRQGKIVWEPNFSCLTTENSLLYQSGMIGEIQHFCDCVLKKKIPQTSIEDACKTMALVARVKKEALSANR